jgi:DNA-binding response OmpR family regulator
MGTCASQRSESMMLKGDSMFPTPSLRQRILVIEDDSKMAQSLRQGLEERGYDAQVAASGEEGFFVFFSFRPDLLILDLNLPGRSGLEILKQLRQQALDVRILVLTSHNEVEERVHGLREGADDYLGKPFAFSELMARIEALLRRGQPMKSSHSLSVADLVLDLTLRRARRSEVSLALTEQEFDLLFYLVENRNRTVSREMLARDVWHETSRFTPIDNVIDVQMARLRRKVDEPFETKLLYTVRGVGFSLREPRS